MPPCFSPPKLYHLLPLLAPVYFATIGALMQVHSSVPTASTLLPAAAELHILHQNSLHAPHIKTGPIIK